LSGRSYPDFGESAAPGGREAMRSIRMPAEASPGGLDLRRLLQVGRQLVETQHGPELDLDAGIVAERHA